MINRGPLRFVTRKRLANIFYPSSFPTVLLTPDSWNDFGYRTSFTAKIYVNQQLVIDLGIVKVLQDRNGETAKLTHLEDSFTQLDDSFCSLGNSLDYYEKLSELDPALSTEFLEAIRDSAVSAKIRDKFETKAGFGDSLLRDPSANAALTYAEFILRKSLPEPEKLVLTYQTRDGSQLTLNFNSIGKLPGRMNALIGYNGVGKTTLLSDLAHVASFETARMQSSISQRQHGKFVGDRPRFPRTVAISFSAFDSFELPDALESVTTDEGKEVHFGYYYCGIRKTTGGPTSAIGLKTESERIDELITLVGDLGTAGRRRSLHTALSILFQEASFERLGQKLDFSHTNWPSDLRLLSSGHQISVSIVIHLAATLQIGSLALLDEPESHLHPPLLAALMKAISYILDVTKSYALVATHSPVVLQEISKSYVHVLRRGGDSRAIVSPGIETYGENLDLLTAEVFNLDATESTYEGVLRALATELSATQIMELFPAGISSQALAVLMQYGVQFDAT